MEYLQACCCDVFASALLQRHDRDGTVLQLEHIFSVVRNHIASCVLTLLQTSCIVLWLLHSTYCTMSLAFACRLVVKAWTCLRWWLVITRVHRKSAVVMANSKALPKTSIASMLCIYLMQHISFNFFILTDGWQVEMASSRTLSLLEWASKNWNTCPRQPIMFITLLTCRDLTTVTLRQWEAKWR